MKSQRPPRFGNLSLPAYFDVLSEDSTETYKLYYPETKDYYATLMFQCADLPATQEDFDSVYLSSIVDSMIASLESDTENRNEIIEYSKSEKTTIARMSGWIITFSLKDKDKGVPSYGSLALVYNINTEQIITILCGYESKGQSSYDYLGDYEKILKSAVLTAGTSSNNTSVSTTDTVAWKQFLKDYEIWVDDYIAFMKKYQANPTDRSLLTDYIKMMDNVSEWEEDSEKMEAEFNDPAELLNIPKNI